MAEIKTLKQGETQVLPRTVAEAVNTDSGLSVQAELDALKESTPDVSAQINEHNVAADAHENRFNQYLPLTGGTMTGNLIIGNSENVGSIPNANTITFSNTPKIKICGYKPEEESFYQLGILNDDGNCGIAISQYETNNAILILSDDIYFSSESIRLSSSYIPKNNQSVVNKKYVDDKIAAIPAPDVSAQIEAHNVSETAHANMHWLTADDEMLSSIDPDGSIDADTLESHPASDFVLKSELSTLVPAPDLSKYYTKEEVDTKITQIQQLIDQAAALVDEINGEVI